MMFDVSNEVVSPGLEEFVEEFYQDRVEEVTVLSEKLFSKDFDTVRHVAHKWSGFSAPYGFHKLGELGKSLEESSTKMDLEESAALINQVELYLSMKGKALNLTS